MDALSDLLKTLKMRNAAIGTLELGAPWGFYVEGLENPTALGLIEGPPCLLEVSGQAPVLLGQGDIALFMRNSSRYALRSDPGAECDDFRQAWRANNLEPFDPAVDSERSVRLDWGARGAQTRLIGLAFVFAAAHGSPLAEAFPETIILRKGDFASLDWIQPAIESLAAVGESAAGFTATATLLAELVFVSMIRSYVLSAFPPTQGWLRGLTDPCIARALQAIHARAGENWSVGTLARVSGMSRTALAVRFAELVGVTPIEYLANWRMHLAAERLGAESANITRLAFELGYASDGAFRAAFKRRFGISPSLYRKQATGIVKRNGADALPISPSEGLIA